MHGQKLFISNLEVPNRLYQTAILLESTEVVIALATPGGSMIVRIYAGTHVGTPGNHLNRYHFTKEKPSHLH